MTGEMGYDAIGLGERDLNYGLPFLKEMIEKYDLPFTNANVRDCEDRRIDSAGVHDRRTKRDQVRHRQRAGSQAQDHHHDRR